MSDSVIPGQRFVDAEGQVHAAGVIGGDFTLCGDAVDGKNGAEPMALSLPMVLTGALIDCKRCIDIVIAAKRIRLREIRWTR